MRWIILICLICMTALLLGKPESSVSIYTGKITEFKQELDAIEQAIIDEDKQLKELAANLINNDISTASLSVQVINLNTGFFKVKALDVKLNGKEVFSKKKLNGRMVKVYNKFVDPGRYTFEFKMVVQGAGYALFSYMKGYKYTVNKTVTVNVPVIGKSKIRIYIFKNPDSDDPTKYLGLKIDTL